MVDFCCWLRKLDFNLQLIHIFLIIYNALKEKLRQYKDCYKKRYQEIGKLYTHSYIYIYIYRKRKRMREREREREREKKIE